MAPNRGKLKVGVLGATGTVGQRFIQILSKHPFFTLHALGASSRSAGRPYAEVVRWKLPTPIPLVIGKMVIQECRPDAEGFSDCSVVFSGLDADVAGGIEEAFRSANLVVFSNAKNFRRDPLCPLIVPLVNPSHLAVIPHQRKTLNLSRGYIVTNANCSTTGIVVPLYALERAFGPLRTVQVVTMQAISGAGYPGVSSLDILDNVVPYIGGEEEKIEWETSKILGGVLPDQTGFDLHADAPIRMSAQCNRVPVIDGHMACVTVEFQRTPKPGIEEVKKAFRAFRCEAQELRVPSAPEQAIVLHEAMDRPQPRLDRDLHQGACVHVGRVRADPIFDIKFVCLLDNVRLGAATSSVMNAEIAVEKGYVT